MENSMGAGKTQLNIYDNCKGLDDSVVGANTNAGYYEEIQDDTLDGEVNDGQVSESRDGGTTKHDDNVRRKDSPTYDNCDVGEAPILNSAYKYALKPVSIVKAADETIIMDHDIYESGDCIVKNDFHGVIWGASICNARNPYGACGRFLFNTFGVPYYMMLLTDDLLEKIIAGGQNSAKWFTVSVTGDLLFAVVVVDVGYWTCLYSWLSARLQ